MLKRLAAIAVVLGFCSAASAGPFTIYDGTNFYYGNSFPYGGQIVNGHTGQATYWQGQAPAFMPYRPVQYNQFNQFYRPVINNYNYRRY